PDGRHCPKCGSVRTREASHAKTPYWYTDCRSYFSVKTGTAMQRSKVPMRKRAIAFYLCLTSLKSVSSMKLHRDIGVTQATAWFMMHRIREAWAVDDDDQFDGPVEVDKSYFGGKRENMSLAKRGEPGLVKSRGEQTCKCQRCICSACRIFDPVEAERLRRRVRSEDSAAGAE
ncbi:MAG: transposase, partial [Chloroflexi bacterium]|nr:transposase [Chloroflexota bacterium]